MDKADIVTGIRNTLEYLQPTLDKAEQKYYILKNRAKSIEDGIDIIVKRDNSAGESGKNSGTVEGLHETLDDIQKTLEKAEIKFKSLRDMVESLADAIEILNEGNEVDDYEAQAQAEAEVEEEMRE